MTHSTPLRAGRLLRRPSLPRHTTASTTALAWAALGAAVALTAAAARAAAPADSYGVPLPPPTSASTTPPPPTSSVIYKWVDDKGVTHMGDRVPKAYEKKARVLQPRPINISQPLSAGVPRATPTDAPAASVAPTTSGGGNGVYIPPGTSAAQAECLRQKKAYADSVACFAQHRQGTRLKSGYEHCPSLPEPTC